MKTKVIRNAAGVIINIGAWDYQMTPVFEDDKDKPIYDEAGAVIGYKKKQTGERAANPMPDGAYEDQAEVATGQDGGLYAAEDYRTLRAGDYPPIGDQLDALFRAGVFPPDMAAQLAAVKAKYPKAG